MEGATIEFKVRTPVGERRMRKNIGWSRRRYADLPEGDERCSTLNIIASGPSALEAPLEHLGPTMALNGALRLFSERGLSPTWWAGCDPQAHMADFVRDPPPSTIYLCASKLDRAVFHRLRERQVRLWHLDDVEVDFPWSIPTATTITLVSLGLAARLGFRRVDVWGWDGCYLDGRDHAVPQIHRREHEVTICVGHEEFQTTGTWALEAQEAVHVIGNFPGRVCIHGPGMIGAIMRHLRPHLCEAA